MCDALRLRSKSEREIAYRHLDWILEGVLGFWCRRVCVEDWFE